MLGAATPSARLTSTFVEGPAGRLEALLREPPHPAGAAVVAHPHPLHGGTMHTKVVHRSARVLSDRFGLSALRFNFRGVGASAGRHDEGRGEVDDAIAAARWIRARVPLGPYVLGGFSFGSVAARNAAGLVKPDVLLLIGFPLMRFGGTAEPPAAGGAVVWIQGERDEFSDPAEARGVARSWGTELLVVPGADHFFTGRLEEFEETLGAALARILPETRS